MKGSNMFHFIYKKVVPKGKKVVCAWFCCDIQLQKNEIIWTRLTVGGDDQLDYNGKACTDTTGLKTIKIHLASIISTKGAKYVAVDIGNLYTNSKLDSPKFTKNMHLSLIPQEIMDRYNAMQYINANVYAYIVITVTIHGLT